MKVIDKKIARQSQSGSAAMARFVYSIHLFLCGIYLAECAIRRRDSADDLYNMAHSALICLKKQFFCCLVACLIV
jgi:hypothetical protein